MNVDDAICPEPQSQEEVQIVGTSQPLDLHAIQADILQRANDQVEHIV